MPDAAELPARLDAVLTVVHLLYTTGHTAPSGHDLVRGDLVVRALDLARMLVALMPDEPEVHGLLGLLLLTTPAGRPAPTRTAAAAARGSGPLAVGPGGHRRGRPPGASRRSPAGPPGRFALQAAIAALHAQAPTYEDTDWPQIVALYDALLRAWPSPGRRPQPRDRGRDGATARRPASPRSTTLAADGRLAGYRYLPAARADLLRRLGRADEAAEAYREALALTDNEAERAFLARRLADCA